MVAQKGVDGGARRLPCPTWESLSFSTCPSIVCVLRTFPSVGHVFSDFSAKLGFCPLTLYVVFLDYVKFIFLHSNLFLLYAPCHHLPVWL